MKLMNRRDRSTIPRSQVAMPMQSDVAEIIADSCHGVTVVPTSQLSDFHSAYTWTATIVIALVGVVLLALEGISK
ncbi:hypothetical protein [Burkholderia multivorans]|uniref:hypothetical protein n=1 Tax=Burkholderia multivorans TaxID=87883 RepID=UPI001C23BCCA|nr:hypothetical protein [Burkholderia multivorans]MBU9480760.1 hypothetical protein [Burkholderia multivorans]